MRAIFYFAYYQKPGGGKFALPCVMKGGVADIKDDEPYHCASIIDSHHFTNSRKFMSQ